MLDKYKEQVLLVQMEKALLALGPEAFLELVQETYGRAKLSVSEDLDDGAAGNMARHEAAIECIILNLEDSNDGESPEDEVNFLDQG